MKMKISAATLILVSAAMAQNSPQNTTVNSQANIPQRPPAPIQGVAPGSGPIAGNSAMPAAPLKEEPPVTTHHSISIAGRTLDYTVVTGMMPLKTEAGEIEANMFYVAYTVDRPQGSPARPLTFSFNGGPGAASVWLHLGALGPRRVKLNDDGSLPPPPYQLVDNDSTWLDKTDLVFIDPVGTGFSRAGKVELGKKFFGVDGDIASVGEFIRLYMTRNQRWMAPIFLAGESYGTTRAAGLSNYLVERGIALNGIALVSTVLNFQTIRFDKGNDLPFTLILPSYAATAWFHKKLEPDLQSDLQKTLKEARAFAQSDYAGILAKGDALTPDERRDAIAKISRYTGLSKEYVDLSNLRIEIHHFIKELLRDRRETVGRLDSRLTGSDALGTSETVDYDPATATIRPPYTAAFNSYVRSELGYQSDLTYYVLGGGIGPWDWGKAQNAYAETGDALRATFTKNPYMKLFVGCGYYDLATPFLATEYTINHLGLTPEAHKNVTLKHYAAGHMFYIHSESLRQLKRDIDAFYDSAVPHQSPSTTHKDESNQRQDKRSSGI